MAKPTILKGKKLDAAIAASYKVHGDCVQVSIWDVGKIGDAGRAAYVNAIGAGEDDATARARLDRAVFDAVQLYRVDGVSGVVYG